MSKSSITLIGSIGDRKVCEDSIVGVHPAQVTFSDSYAKMALLQLRGIGRVANEPEGIRKFAVPDFPLRHMEAPIREIDTRDY